MRTLILLILAGLLQAAPLFYIDSVPEIAGNELIRAETADSAKQAITSESYKDSAYFYLRKAELAILNKQYSDARQLLLKATLDSSDFVPFAYRRIGDVEMMDGNVSYAIVSYRTAAELTSLAPYRFFLNERIDSLGKAYESELQADGWHTLLFPDWVDTTGKDTLLPKLKARLNTDVTEVEFDSLLAVAKKNNLFNTLKVSLRDTAKVKAPFSTKRRFDHAKYLSSKGHHSSASQWLHSAIIQSDFSKKVPEKEYFRFRSVLNYSLKNWSNSVTWSKKYFDKYGYTSQLIYNTARAYRRMGMSQKANYWYEMHVKRYPSLQRSHDILWYQAWQYEDRGSFDTAIVRFNELSTKFAQKKYGDDAAFRVGLLYFRKGEYAKSVTAFDDFMKRFKNSKLRPGGYYWKGRALHELKKEKESRAAFDYVEEEWPLDYFAWRARQFTNDTTYRISTTDFDPWYDSLKAISKSVKDTLAAFNEDSLFTIAVQMGTLGYHDEAALMLEPFEIRGHKNYALLFELSKLYDIIGEHYHAFKITKSIFWALPSGLRKSLPVEYIKRLYPEAFPDEVSYAAKRMNVNPHLVRAIMRQESMFSPTIRSWVGARGLMQIMPYTGKEIADDLDTTYNDDMLDIPEVNVTFGTHYIGKLLKQFNQHNVKAVASYNGGPHNVKKWVDRSKDVLHDEPFFSECIGFSETRNYVKRVLENLWIYETLEKQFVDDSTGTAVVVNTKEPVVENKVPETSGSSTYSAVESESSSSVQ